jgi:NAD(P)H-quinone oxidoreductase subunit K
LIFICRVVLLIKLRKKVSNESIQERAQLRQIHRYYSTTHTMVPTEVIHDGTYLQAESRIAPPRELAEAMGLEVPAVLEPQKEGVDRG